MFEDSVYSQPLESPPYPDVRSAVCTSSMRDLCSSCRDINVRKLFSDKNREWQGLSVTLQEILHNKTSCNLCFLTATVLEVELPHGQLLQEIGGKQLVVRSSREWMRYVDWSYVRGMEHSDPAFARFVESLPGKGLMNVLEVRLADESFPGSISIAQVVDQRWPRPKQQYGQRLLQQKMDTDLVQSWRRLCQQQHAERCSQPQWLAAEAPSSLRLIDVKTRTVVSAPQKAVYEYATLSYVWGDSSLQVMADLANFKQGSFRLPQLPATIEDAISITSQLGISYLWVDALCMAQRPAGNADKEHQLGQMDRIYKSAELTIIAAGCESVADAIPGVHGRLYPSLTTSVDGLQLAVMLPRFQEDMYACTWYQRAWTYQELTLSKRALVFGKTQVYWLCQCDLWCESVVLEPAEAGTPDFVWQPLPDTSKPPRRFLPVTEYCFVTEEVLNEENMVNAYASLVKHYTEKRMTYPDDGLNAVAGVLNILQNLDEKPWGTTHCGLPEAFFDGCLLWMPKTTAQRPLEWASHAKLPSWSWAGWFSNVGDGMMWEWLILQDRFSIIPAIDWYLVDEYQRSIPMRKHLHRQEYTDNVEETHEKSPELRNPPGIDHHRISEGPPKLPSSLPPWPDHFLHFLTTTCDLYIGRKLPDHSDHGVSPQEKLHQLSIYLLEDIHGTFVGAMVMPEPLALRLLAPRRPLECIFLSYARQLGSVLSPASSDEQAYLPTEVQCFKRERYGVVNIMWISRFPEGYAERVLTGQALESCWLATKPKTEWIILG